MIEVLIIDDHMAVGMGTKALIETEDICADVLFDSAEYLSCITKKKYDVYLVDLFMPNLNGLEVTKGILKHDPDAAIIIYTGFDIEPHFNLLLENDISGIISKTASKEQMITTIRCAKRKEVVIPLGLFRQLRIQQFSAKSLLQSEKTNELPITLTQREREILIFVQQGMTNKNIALTLNLSQRSIEYTLTELFNKLRVSSRVEAVEKAKSLGILSKINL
ncbi:response regulator transcription factor [Bacillus paranthracis]|uniref:response regulator transcription factor n=1 Tax=Bacillus paranthracis TaxID=2026186 RepID=UPI001E5AB414|nr:response regulator transcription factor [Bacillus paranthracis]MCC2437425.1 response regulator transcription factor [Bacillus paranthracis]